MDSREILSWLDSAFSFDGHSYDKSMLSRRQLIPPYALSRMNAAFTESMNGCAMLLTEKIRKVFFSAFLTDEVVERACEMSDSGAMLVVHHLFDMHCGTPGATNAVPFHFIDISSFRKLLDCGVSLYSAHLPFDKQACPFNTSLTFADFLGLRILSPLSLSSLPDIGYAAETELELAKLTAKCFPVFENYGKIYSFSGTAEKTAVIGGVVSSSAVMELESLGFDNLVCGDVLVRTGGQRYIDTLKTVSDSQLSILCVSHLKSEQPAVKAMAEAMGRAFPSVEVLYLPEYTGWK